MTKNKGVALILSVIILTAVLAIALTAGKIFTDKIKMSRNTSDSMKAYYAAESGIEWALHQYKTTGSLPICNPSCIATVDGAEYEIKIVDGTIKAIGKARETRRGVEVQVAQAQSPSEQEKFYTVAYKPSDNLLYGDHGVSTTNSMTWTKLKEITVENIHSSKFRIKFDLCQSFPNSFAAYAQIYKNGNTYGAKREISGCFSPVTYTEDLSFTSGDKIAIYAYTTHSTNSIPTVSNFSINGTLDGDGHFWYPYSK